eukprot:49885_1
MSHEADHFLSDIPSKKYSFLTSPVIYDKNMNVIRVCVQPSFTRMLLKHSLQSRLIIQLTPYLSQQIQCQVHLFSTQCDFKDLTISHFIYLSHHCISSYMNGLI